MEIKDLKPNQGNVDLVVEVVEKKEARTFEKFGKSGRVCNAVVKDSTGQVTLTLWNEDVDKVSPGSKIHLKNGWCSSFRDEMQVSTGKFGSLEVLETSSNEVFTNDPGMLQGAPEGMEEGVEDSDEPFDEEEMVE